LVAIGAGAGGSEDIEAAMSASIAESKDKEIHHNTFIFKEARSSTLGQPRQQKRGSLRVKDASRMGALEHARSVRSATATCASTTLREFASTAQVQWLKKSKKVAEPLSSKNSFHRNILDGNWSPRRARLGGS